MERFVSEKITSEELSILDNNSEWLGIDKSLLMECAGYSLTTEIVNKYQLNKNTKVAIFAGTGNNGGDAFVVARHLASQVFQFSYYYWGVLIKLEQRNLNRIGMFYLIWSILLNERS